MKKTKIRLATTHLDRHNERFTVEALKSIVRQSNKGIIPLGSEHDPRIAPLGRVIHTELIELDDGEFAIDGIAEIYDSDFSEIENLGEREIPIRKYENGSYSLVVDRTFRDSESQNDINDLEKILNNVKAEEEIKKAVDPISILTIGGAFVLGGIANGFLGDLGSDAYKALKQKLQQVFSKSNGNSSETLFKLDTTVINANRSINVEVIITNPTKRDIENFFENGIKELDQALPSYFNEDLSIAKIVYEYKEPRLTVKFAITKQGIPLYPNQNNNDMPT